MSTEEVVWLLFCSSCFLKALSESSSSVLARSLIVGFGGEKTEFCFCVHRLGSITLLLIAVANCLAPENEIIMVSERWLNM